MTDELPWTNAATDPAALAELEMLVGVMRASLAPVLHAAADNDLPRMQGVLVTAAVMMAGMTVGHMLAVGVIDASKGHVDQFAEAAKTAFSQGVEQGRAEALRAMIKMPFGGRA